MCVPVCLCACVPVCLCVRAQDIDDALHCRVLPNGNFEVGVHIADVSHFVEHNCAMDKEAADRSNTTYLVDRRLDMLPVSDCCFVQQRFGGLLGTYLRVLVDFLGDRYKWY